MADRILILAPHTDDGELGCGGTIARFLEEGNEVYYVAFSTCRSSVPDDYPEDILKTELLRAMESLQIPQEQVIILDYPVREFSAHRQEILDDMIRINHQVQPTMVFAPSQHDVHQDHQVISNEALRAFKTKTLLGYEEPWNNFTFENQAYIALEPQHLEAKIKAISCYETQKKRTYASAEFTTAQAHLRGVQVGCEYAEVFEVVRWIQ